MGEEVYYSSGQAARELGVTQAKIRALCESEVIDSTLTAGGQYRIRRDELERLKRDGLPPIPRPLPDPECPRPVSRTLRPSHDEVNFSPEPSEAVINAAETVACLEHEVKAVELQKQKGEGLDWFRERETRAAAEKSDRDEVERLRRSQEEAVLERERWSAKWAECGLRSVPADVPRAYLLEVHRRIEETLQRLNVTQPDSITRDLIHAAVEGALEPWNKQRRITNIIKETYEAYYIPAAMRFDSSWKARMNTAAADAITGLRENASADEMRIAARNAITPLVRECESVRARAAMVESLWIPSANRGEQAQGKEAVATALAKLPISASKPDLEEAQTTALEPVRAAIAVRLEKELRASLSQPDVRFWMLPEHLRTQATAALAEAFDGLPVGTPESELRDAKETVIERFQRTQNQQERKSRLIDWGLRQIPGYVDRLSRTWEFEDSAATVSWKLEKPIRAFLQERLRGNESEEQVAALVRRSVRDDLDIR